MKIRIDPDRIEELSQQIKRFSMDIEDCERHIYRTVMNLLWQVEAKYHESYVRADTRRIREVLERMHRHAEEASWELYTLSQEAHNAAVGYRNNESQLARMIAQSTIRFSLNLSLQKALSGIYRVTGVSTAIGSRLAVGNLNIKLGTGSVTALLAGGSMPVLTTGVAAANTQEDGKKQQEAMAKLDEILRVEQKIIAGEIYPTYHIAKLLSEKNSVIEELLRYEKDEKLRELLIQVKKGYTYAWEEYKQKTGYESISGTDFIFGDPDVWLIDKQLILNLYELAQQVITSGGIYYWSLSQAQKEILCRGLGMNINCVTDELIINRLDYIRVKYSIVDTTATFIDPTFIDEKVIKGIIEEELRRQAAATWKKRIPLYLQSIEKKIRNTSNGYIEFLDLSIEERKAIQYALGLYQTGELDHYTTIALDAIHASKNIEYIDYHRWAITSEIIHVVIKKCNEKIKWEKEHKTLAAILDFMEQYHTGEYFYALVCGWAYNRLEGTRSTVGKLTGSLDGLTSAERKVVNDLLSQGKNVEIIPRSNVQGVSTPDFIINGVKTELKTLNGTSLNTPVTRITDAFKQGADAVIIDARNVGITAEQANQILNRAAGTYQNKVLPGQVEIWTVDGIIRR